MPKNPNTFHQHLTAVKDGKLRFENAFQGVSRMILETEIEKVVVNGKTTYDFKIFRNGSKHVIGMYDEINSFVSYVKDAAEGGSSKEMAFVLVGEPGNGKTFFVEFLASKYRNFLGKRSQTRLGSNCRANSGVIQLSLALSNRSEYSSASPTEKSNHH